MNNGQINNNKKENNKYSEKFNRYLSITALFFSIVIPTLTFVCNRHELAKLDKEYVQAEVQINYENIKIKELQPGCRCLCIRPTKQRDYSQYFSGISIFVDVFIDNLGARPINVKKIESCYIVDNSACARSFSIQCFGKNLTDTIYFPISINPNTQQKIVIEIPWCIHQDEYKYLRRLESYSTYNSYDILRLYEDDHGNWGFIGRSGFTDALGAYYRHYLYPKIISKDTSFKIRIKIEFSSGTIIERLINIDELAFWK